MMSNRYRRKPATRNPREAIAIYTEGTVTEVEYFEAVMRMMGIPKELVCVRRSEHSDPKGLVDDAVCAKKQNENDARRKGVGLIEKWWVLADTECGRPGLNDAVQKAKDNSIWLGFCDPSFEFWLLLHFCYTTQPFESVKTLMNEVDKHLLYCDEHKKHLNMEVLLPLLPAAMKNAAKLRKNHTLNNNGSPRTDCDLLVAELNLQAGLGRELPLPGFTPSFEDLSMHHCGFR